MRETTLTPGTVAAIVVVTAAAEIATERHQQGMLVYDACVP
jgi:hypothetical protein